MIFVLVLLVVAMGFEYMNGFNDSANAIATSVATKTLTPRQAIVLASICDLLGALAGTAVAKTVAAGLVDTEVVNGGTILCALLAAIFWNLVTWRFAIPSSSSHALIGGLIGATVATAHGHWSVVKWSNFNPATHHMEGLLHKVVIPMVVAPILGLLCGYIFMGFMILLNRGFRPDRVNAVFGPLQAAAAAWTSFTHGMNDAQKTMGIMALTLFTATRHGRLDHLPRFLGFLRTPTFEVALWIKVLCAATIAAGIATGGFRIIRTVGRKLTRLQKSQGFAAQTAGAAVIQGATLLGIPLSTTHVISSSIMGVGATKSLKAVKWRVMGKIVCAWVLTLPITCSLGYGFFSGLKLLGLVASFD